MLYADDAGINFSKSAEGLAKMMAAIVTVFEAAHRPHHGIRREDRDNASTNTRPDNPRTTALRHRSSRPQRYKQTAILYLLLTIGSIIHENADDLSLEIDRRIRLMRACLKRFGLGLYDRTTAPLLVQVRINAEGRGERPCCTGVCDVDPLRAEHFARLRKAHHHQQEEVCPFSRVILASSADFVLLLWPHHHALVREAYL